MITIDSLRGEATITVPQAAELLGIGRDAGYEAVRRGEIPALRLGRTLRVPVPELLRMLGDLGPSSGNAEGRDRVQGPSLVPLKLLQ